MTTERQAHKFHTDDALLSRSEQWCIISMEFLCTFLRCHITWKSVVASQNVGCFLRLIFDWTLSMTPSGTWSLLIHKNAHLANCKENLYFIRSQLMLYSTYPFTAMLQEYVVNCCARFLCFVLLSGQNIPSIRKIKANSSSLTEPDVGQAAWLKKGKSKNCTSWTLLKLSYFYSTDVSLRTYIKLVLLVLLVFMYL